MCVGGLLCSCGQWLTCMCFVMCCWHLLGVSMPHSCPRAKRDQFPAQHACQSPAPPLRNRAATNDFHYPLSVGWLNDLFSLENVRKLLNNSQSTQWFLQIACVLQGTVQNLPKIFNLQWHKTEESSIFRYLLKWLINFKVWKKDTFVSWDYYMYVCEYMSESLLFILICF